MSGNFPTVTAGGVMLPAMDNARMRALSWDIFHAIEGPERLRHEADRDFKWYMEKVHMPLMLKGAAVNVEHRAGPSMEDLLEKMDRSANAQLIEVTATEVENAAETE